MERLRKNVSKEGFSNHHNLWIYAWWGLFSVRLPSKSRSGKIPWNRLGTVFVSPRNSIPFAEFHVSLNSPFWGSEWMEIREKMRQRNYNKKTFHRSKASYQCKCYRQLWTKNNAMFFISRSIVFRNDFPKVFSCQQFGTKFECFSLMRNT